MPAVCFAVGAWFGGRTDADFAKFLLAAGVILAAAVWRSPRPGSHLALLVGLGLAGAGIGSRASLGAADGSAVQDGPHRIEGLVEGVWDREDGFSVQVALETVDGAKVRGAAALASKARLYEGQRISAAVRMARLRGPDNPGQYDWAAAKLRAGVLWSGRLVTLESQSPPSRWRVRMAQLRSELAEATARLAPSQEAAALFLTLAAGLRASLSDEAERDFSASGLAHVLSVSGLHVAALALCVLAALRWLLTRLPGISGDVRRPAALASVPLIWAYVVFTGWQPPAVRSALMASLVLVGLTFPRPADALNALAFALVGLVLVRPSAVAELSLQLSFTAVLALLLLTPALLSPFCGEARQRPDPADRFAHWRAKAQDACLQTFFASIAVTLATAPLAAAAFQRISIAGLVSNVVAMPLCAALTLVAAFAAAVFVVAPWAATPLLWAGAWMSELLMALARLFARTPLSVLDLTAFPAPAAAAYAAALAVFALVPRGRLAALAVVAGLIGAQLVGPLGSRDEVRVTFLAVGQGDSVVISAGGQHALVDGGGVPQGADVGERVVLPFLRQQRIRALDLAVLSHPHPDHALGLISAVRQLPARRVWYAAGTEGGLTSALIAAAQGAEIEAVEAGSATARIGPAELTVLGPPADRELLEGVNDRSAVLLLRHGEVTFLLTGDVEEAGEAELRLPGTVTVLKAPHHGSRTSSGWALVEASRPRYVVFCVGRNNRFGFPHPEVVERWQAVGARCLRTDRAGAITFVSDGRDVRLETWHPAGGEAVAPDGLRAHL